MKAPGKWASDVTPEMPAADAARRVVEARAGSVSEWLDRAAEFRHGSGRSARAVHELRVATRRAETALEAFGQHLEGRAADKLRGRLKKIRSAAGRARDVDVQRAALEPFAKSGTGAQRECVRRLLDRLAERRERAQRALADAAGKYPEKKVRRAVARAIAGKSGEGPAPGGERVRAASRPVVVRAVGHVRAAVATGLKEPVDLHALRLRLKRLRYTFELFASCVEEPERRRVFARLIDAQDALGEINDAAELVSALRRDKGAREDRAAGRGARAIAGLLRAQGKVLKGRREAFARMWGKRAWDDVLGAVTAAFEPSPAPNGVAARGVRARGAVLIEPKSRPSPVKGPDLARRNGTVHGPDSAERAAASPRLAAIDVGSNSVRLIIAEASPGGSYRVLDDEKEITRLARGLSETGKMDPGAIEHTLVTIERMVSIARGYGAERVRIVGTSAAREARNRETLARLVKQRVGIDFEIISGEDEALLAYQSAANAFDLSQGSALVVDIGGGSTELVLSGPGKAVRGKGGTGDSGAARGDRGTGVVERVWTLPLGAVRLTEMFGGPERAARKRFEELTAHIKRTLKGVVRRPAAPPLLVVGTGGTLTTLAAMAMSRDLWGAGGDAARSEGLFTASVQGHAVSRADIRHTLEYVRRLPVKERVRVPGLPADRADIIVAGLAVVDAVLKRFNANTVRIHEGGIRDGLLLGMVRGLAVRGGPAEGRDPMASVRRFARSCNYESAHAEHVTGLSLSIFDQLRDGGGAQAGRGKGGAGLDAEARSLLEAAAVLHDVGYLISYAAHHKHSYHLIVHADLPGWTTRQVQVIANVARYHRGAEPKGRHQPFAVLAESDRGLVRMLAAILRVADGLDRPHVQRVSGVRARIADGAVHFEVASADEPSVELWGAARKSGLFREFFDLLPHFDWQRVRGGAKVAPRPENSAVVTPQ